MNAYSFKTKFNYTIIISLTLLIIFSCSPHESKMKEAVVISDVSVKEDYGAVSDENPDKINTIETNKVLNQLKIIKSADVKYKVKNVKQHTDLIKKHIAPYNAYISDLRFLNNSRKKENRFIIKIPSQYFDAVIDSISKNVEFVDYENITTKDVSEEYVDLQTRLKTKEEVKERYEAVLRKKATKVEDILLAEDKIRVIQEEIEAAKGRLNYLSNKVSFSTIEVNLYETVDYKEEPISYHKTFGSKTKEGFQFGWKIVENFFLGIIHIWPFLLIGFGLLLFFKKRKTSKK